MREGREGSGSVLREIERVINYMAPKLWLESRSRFFFVKFVVFMSVFVCVSVPVSVYVCLCLCLYLCLCLRLCLSLCRSVSVFMSVSVCLCVSLCVGRKELIRTNREKADLLVSYQMLSLLTLLSQNSIFDGVDALDSPLLWPLCV